MATNNFWNKNSVQPMRDGSKCQSLVFAVFFVCREQGGSFLKFVMLLKWQSSIRICSQIWQYSKYEHKKFLSMLSSCYHLQAVVRILENQKKKSQFLVIFFSKKNRVCDRIFFLQKKISQIFPQKKITSRGRGLRGFWIWCFHHVLICFSSSHDFPQAVPNSIIFYPISCAQSYNSCSIYIYNPTLYIYLFLFFLFFQIFCVENVNIL